MQPTVAAAVVNLVIQGFHTTKPWGMQQPRRRTSVWRHSSRTMLKNSQQRSEDWKISSDNATNFRTSIRAKSCWNWWACRLLIPALALHLFPKKLNSMWEMPRFPLLRVLYAFTRMGCHTLPPGRWSLFLCYVFTFMILCVGCALVCAFLSAPSWSNQVSEWMEL